MLTKSPPQRRIMRERKSVGPTSRLMTVAGAWKKIYGTKNIKVTML